MSMRRALRLLVIVVLWIWPSLAKADEACVALGHLMLAADLMRIAAEANLDLESSYGPSIGASIRSSAIFTPEFEERDPEKVSALLALRDVAAGAFAVVAAGQAERATLDQIGQGVAIEARGLYIDWICDEPDPGTQDGATAEEIPARHDLSRGGIGQGGGASFRAVWVALGRENPIERAVLLGCFATSVILLPYLVLRDRRNKRRAERHVCASPTSIVMSNRRIAARFFDISVSGARIIINQVIPPGTELTVEVAGADHRARVARSGKGYAGLQFEELLSRSELKAQLELAQATMLFPRKKSA